MSQQEWLDLVEREMVTRFSLNADDLGWGEEEKSRYFSFGEAPADFASWFGMKYDLTDRRILEFGRDSAQRMAR